MLRTVIAIIILGSTVTSGAQIDSSAGPTSRYTFYNLYSVGIYVHPSDYKLRDVITQNILKLHFQSLGYHIVDLNDRLGQASKLKGRGFRENLEYICASNKNSADLVDVAVCVESKWEKITKRISYSLDLNLPVMQSQVKIVNVHSQEVILQGSSNDTMQVFNLDREGEGWWASWKVSTNSIRHMVERNLTQFINFFPVSSYQVEDSASYAIPVIIYADQNYRDQYGYKWKTMLRRRMVFVNDVYRKYFDLEFTIKGFKAWETNYQDSLSYVIGQLIEDTRDIQDVIVLAVVLDRGIVFNRILFSSDMDERIIGMALLLRNRCAIKDLPTTKALRIWDSVEESVVMIHELAHLLGGVHILDPRSNMFPAAGTMSYQFDNFNTNIINLTKERIFQLKKTSQLREYVEEILKLYRQSEAKNIYISGLIGILGNHYIQAGGSEDSLKYIFRVPWTLHAARGYIYYEREEWEKSCESYHNAIKCKEDIGSLYSDLGRSYSKRDKKKKANQYYKKARDKGLRIIELE
jgi:hypothetical protein